MNWIEVVDGEGRVVARRMADAVPCIIGSAHDNALVIEGDDVSAYHARIDREADGRLTMTVLGQSTPIRRPGAPEGSLTLVLSPTAPVALGGWTVRLISELATPAAAVAAPVPTVESARTGWRSVIARRPVQWGAAGLLALAGAAIGYYTLPGSDRWLNALVVSVGLLIAECVWVGFWAMVGRLRHGRARFGQHFVAGTAIAAAGWLFGEFESWQRFLLPQVDGLAVFLALLSAGLWIVGILVHLRVMTSEHWEKHLRTSVIAGMVLFILTLATERYRGSWNSDIEFSAVLKPLTSKLVPAHSPEQFTSTLTRLQKQLDDDDDAAPKLVEEAADSLGDSD